MLLDKPLGKGLISDVFKKKGISTFEDAFKWVNGLPYNRNSTKEDVLIVLKESCGTCSSKHELIKRLAEENDIMGCSLVLCMFKMAAINAPRVKSVLDKYGLEYIPEAHTYLTINGEVVDLTFPDNPELLYLKDILFTEEITADQIKVYKAETHRAYIRKWGRESGIPYDFEELWGIREECIAELSE